MMRPIAHCTFIACLLSFSTHALNAQAGGPVTTVILVRHAEREALSISDPPLTAAGRERAIALRATLGAAGVQAIIVTQFVRTSSTAQPLADLLGLVPEVVRDTGESHATTVANVIMKQHAGQTVLVVGHGHTVPAIIRALGGSETEPTLCETQFDLLFVVSIPRTGRVHVARTRYGAATPCSISRPTVNTDTGPPMSSVGRGVWLRRTIKPQSHGAGLGGRRLLGGSRL